jgi:histidine ammonia-lyase
VHGSAKDALAWAESVLMTEADSATDNPLVFPGRGTVSAGNFHGHPIAMAMDFAVNALCAWGNMSERRTSNLLHPAMNNKLPAFLSFKPGINSGLMMPQVTAAALCAENKLLAAPASADTIPTSADQEDHVSMSNHAARKLRSAVENAERILAIELYCSCQAREFHRSIKAGLGAQAAHEQVRKYLPRLKNDRYLAPELDKVHDLIRSGEIVRAAESAAGELRP